MRGLVPRARWCVVASALFAAACDGGSGGGGSPNKKPSASADASTTNEEGGANHSMHGSCGDATTMMDGSTDVDLGGVSLEQRFVAMARHDAGFARVLRGDTVDDLAQADVNGGQFIEQLMADQGVDAGLPDDVLPASPRLRITSSSRRICPYRWSLLSPVSVASTP